MLSNRNYSTKINPDKKEGSYIDTLTGLKNSDYLEDSLKKYLNQSKNNIVKNALLFIDINEFKKFKNMYGFDVGKELLRTSGKIFKSCVANKDMVSRIDADGFTILLTDISEDNYAVSIADKVINMFNNPLNISGKEFFVDLSIGIFLFSNNDLSELEIIRRAHMAACNAKKLGKNKYDFYESKTNNELLYIFNMENDLRHAIDNNEFALYYQPKINAGIKKLYGMEALIRWEHPVKGLMMPIEFISIAEKNDLIIPIGNWVIKTACAQNKLWQEKGYSKVPVSVNISPKQLQHPSFVEEIVNVLKETRLEAEYLELEITESTLVKSLDTSIKTINKLRAMGIKISLDDFGTGYSSLNYLRILPIDTIKIDKSFIKYIKKDDNVDAIISAIILLCKKMKLEITAEGVETLDQLDYLMEQGCNQIQGYLFSRPEPVFKIEDIIKKGTIAIERDSWVYYQI